MQVFFKKLKEDAQLPTYGTEHSAGMDVRSTESVNIQPGSSVAVSTGLAVAIPPGHEMQVRSRSGLALKQGLVVLNSPGTIDSDYRGEIKVILHNASDLRQSISAGDRIAQLVVAPYVKAEVSFVENLDATTRGDRGFGSTGVK